MHISKLSLLNFKNYHEVNLQFTKGVNCFTGNNGSGKTNLLDAIYYLGLTKSYFNNIDSQLIKHGEQLFVIQGDFENNDNSESIFCGLKLNQKKQFKRNQKDYNRLSDHIGLLQVVMISPVDHSLITEGSEERRKFIDSIIAQTDKNYLEDLIAYNKLLAQRNALLKQLSRNETTDLTSLEIWNEQIAPIGERIFAKRKLFLESFIPVFNSYYQFLSAENESVSLSYTSHLFENKMLALLHQSLKKDLILQYTTHGIHKDDLEFVISGYPLKKTGSQGQQKTFLIALKLAQFDFFSSLKNSKPILLLDDIFDKLDDNRVTKLMELVSKETFGQIFITDTHPERLKNIFSSIDVPVKLFNVDNLKVSEVAV